MTGPEAPETQVWDALMDLVALVTAYRGEDEEGLRVLMEHADKPLVLAVSLHLLAQLAQEHHADYRSLLAWAFISLDGKAT